VRKKEHIVDIMFVLLVLLLFVTFGFCVIMVGARVYQSTVDQMEENYSSGTALAYTVQKLRQNNQVGTIEMTKIDEEDGILIHSQVKDVDYATYIYFCDGYLWELYTKASTVVHTGMGQKLVQVKDFTIEKVDRGLYQIEAVSTSDEELEVMIHVLEETN
jgi:hypothetical protein